MFFRRRQLRQWAASMLVVWLFGVVAGLAHACLVGSLDTSAQPLAAASNHPHHDRDDGSGPGKRNCVDLCEKSSLTVPGGSSSLDALGPGFAALPAAFTMVPPAPAAAAVHVPAPEQRRPALPIPIAFLRLAL